VIYDEGFTLGYSRDRPVRGSSHSVCKAIFNRYRTKTKSKDQDEDRRPKTRNEEPLLTEQWLKKDQDEDKDQE